MVRNIEQENTRLDEAARAGWLYYIAGNTQDEIAQAYTDFHEGKYGKIEYRK